MNSKDAYDIAAKIVDLILKNLGFFIGICSLFDGWIVVGGSLHDLAIGKKRALAFIFSAASITMVSGQISLLKRATAALAISRTLYEIENTTTPKLLEPVKLALFDQGRIWPTIYGMGGVILFLNMLILFA